MNNTTKTLIGLPLALLVGGGLTYSGFTIVENNKLKNDNQNLTEIVTQITDENTLLKKDKDALILKVSGLETDKRDLQNSLNQAHSLLIDIDKKLDSTSDITVIEDLQAQRTKTLALIDTLQTSIEEKDARIAELEDRIRELENQGQTGTETITPTSAQYFTFDGNTITGYTGTDTEVVVPRSYSMNKTLLDTNEFTDYSSFHDYVMDNDISYPITIGYNDVEFIANSLEDIDMNDDLCQAANIAILNYDYEYFDGNDYEITTLGRSCFTDNTQLTKITFLDNIVDFEKGYSSPFRGVSAELVFPSNFLSQATDLSYLFDWYDGVTLDVSNLNTSNVVNMSYMFSSQSASNLRNIIGLDKFDTSNVKDMSDMFLHSKVYSVDLSSFTIDSLENTSGMFNFSNIGTIYVSETNSDWTNGVVVNSDNMFDSCRLLPNYNESEVDISKAKLSTDGGYFTLKEANA